MAPPNTRPRSPPAVMEELVEEILLRVQPDEPAHLFRAALVCKPWRRILTDPGFLRRYHAFHRAPLLLGYLHDLDDNPAGIPRLAPTTAAPRLFSTWPDLNCAWWAWALDCRHGRVLIRTLATEYLVVWDPITGGQKKLNLPGDGYIYDTGAVLCAVDGCDHLDCHDGPFLVVLAGSSDDYCKTWVDICSSETGLWSPSVSIGDHLGGYAQKSSLLIGDRLYFSSISYYDGEFGDTLMFDLGTHELSLIPSPRGLGYKTMAMAMEVDGELGFVSVDKVNYCICLWSWQGDDNNGICGWARCMVMELETLLPIDPFFPFEVVGLLEGTNTIFISVSTVGLFTLDLKSRKVKKVGKRGYNAILPYTSFYTPDLSKGTHHYRHQDARIATLT